MISRRSVLALLALTAPLALSCLDVAEGRARRDLEVGKASLGEARVVRVVVDEGLAAVRRLGPGELSLWASAPALTVRLAGAAGGPWTVTIENMLADAELSARVGDERVPVELVAAPFPTERTFRVSLPPGAEAVLSLRPRDEALLEPWRFAVFADVQEEIDRVQDIYAKMNATEGIRFALISGDLTSQGAPEQLERFQREMKTLAFPCYATLGNHELGTRDDLYHEWFGRGNYRFVFRGVHFTMLDSASATIDPLAYGWLSGWLGDGRDLLHVVTMHLPPLDPVGTRNGAFASRAEGNKLLTMLADGRVDLTFYGHIHSFYAFENAGIPAYISGGGGAIPERLDGIGRHFVTVDVEPPGRVAQVAVVRVD